MNKPRFHMDHTVNRPRHSNRDIGRCPVTGKKRYPDKVDAKAVKRMNGLKVSVYRCQHCGSWELGGLHGKDRAYHAQKAAQKVNHVFDGFPGAAA